MITYDFLGLAVIALACWRLWKLAAEDVILDPIRDRVLGTTTLAGGVTHYRRAKLATFIGCPWCFGFWLSVGAFAAWHWWSHTNTVLIAIPLALSTITGLLTKLDE